MKGFHKICNVLFSAMLAFVVSEEGRMVLKIIGEVSRSSETVVYFLHLLVKWRIFCYPGNNIFDKCWISS